MKNHQTLLPFFTAGRLLISGSHDPQQITQWFDHNGSFAKSHPSLSQELAQKLLKDFPEIASNNADTFIQDTAPLLNALPSAHDPVLQAAINVFNNASSKPPMGWDKAYSFFHTALKNTAHEERLFSYVMHRWPSLVSNHEVSAYMLLSEMIGAHKENPAYQKKLTALGLSVLPRIISTEHATNQEMLIDQIYQLSQQNPQDLAQAQRILLAPTRRENTAKTQILMVHAARSIALVDAPFAEKLFDQSVQIIKSADIDTAFDVATAFICTNGVNCASPTLALQSLLGRLPEIFESAPSKIAHDYRISATLSSPRYRATGTTSQPMSQEESNASGTNKDRVLSAFLSQTSASIEKDGLLLLSSFSSLLDEIKNEHLQPQQVDKTFNVFFPIIDLIHDRNYKAENFVKIFSSFCKTQSLSSFAQASLSNLVRNKRTPPFVKNAFTETLSDLSLFDARANYLREQNQGVYPSHKPLSLTP